MPILESILSRYSVRAYQDKPVEQEKLDRILEAARLAPSACNRQEWRFVIVRDPEKRRRLVECASGQAFVGQAPVVIVACAKHDGRIMRCGQACGPIDVAIALEHIALQAAAEGLGTCWIGAFDEGKAKEICGIPTTDDVRVIELMPLGYPADTPREKSRLAFEEIVMYEEWEG